MIVLVLPYPPTVNHAYRRAKQGGMFKTAATKTFQDEVAVRVMMARAKKRLEGRLQVHYLVSMPDRRKRDLANVEKLLTDALQYAGVFIDDFQIDRLLLERGPVVKGGSVRATIAEIAP